MDIPSRSPVRGATAAPTRLRLHGAGALGCVVVVGVLSSGAARAQDVPEAPPPPGPTDTNLPHLGADPTLSDLREHLLSSYGDTQAAPTGVTGPNLRITGSVGLSEEYTDNAGLANTGATGKRADYITQFQPVLNITDTSQRLQVNLNYSPTGQLYAENGNFSQFEEAGNGAIHAAAIQNLLFVDLRGSISQQSILGGVGPSTTTTLSPSERETVSSFSVSPYFTRGFGGTGTAQLGVAYIYSATDAPNLNAAALTPLEAELLRIDPALGAQLNTNYGSSSLSTERFFTNFATGDDFGRLRDEVSVDANFYSGESALNGGHRVVLTDDASYAFTRLITGLGEIGYEGLDYPGSDYRYAGPIGSGGVQLHPRPGSTLTIEYRYVDGFGSVFSQASVQVSPRIRVFGGYSEGISTFDQDQQNTLLDGNDVTGVAANALIAAPVLTGLNSFGANQNLNRLNRLDVTATYLGNLDTVTATVNRQSTTPIGRQIGTAVLVSNSGIFGSLGDTHQFSDSVSVNAFVQYGTNDNGLANAGSTATLSVAAGITKTFPHQLSVYLRYGGNYFLSGSAIGRQGQSPDQNLFVIGGVKTF